MAIKEQLDDLFDLNEKLKKSLAIRKADLNSTDYKSQQAFEHNMNCARPAASDEALPGDVYQERIEYDSQKVRKQELQNNEKVTQETTDNEEFKQNMFVGFAFIFSLIFLLFE